MASALPLGDIVTVRQDVLNVPRPEVAVRMNYCATKLGSDGSRITGGGFHFPVSASDFGAYMRMSKLNAVFGAGSQLASLFAPGLSF